MHKQPESETKSNVGLQVSENKGKIIWTITTCKKEET